MPFSNGKTTTKPLFELLLSYQGAGKITFAKIMPGIEPQPFLPEFMDIPRERGIFDPDHSLSTFQSYAKLFEARRRRANEAPLIKLGSLIKKSDHNSEALEFSMGPVLDVNFQPLAQHKVETQLIPASHSYANFQQTLFTGINAAAQDKEYVVVEKDHDDEDFELIDACEADVTRKRI